MSTFPLTFPYVFGDGTEEPPVAVSAWAPYRPPKRKPCGWRVGPSWTRLHLAESDGAGLPAQVQIVQTNIMDVAAATGDGLVGNVAITTWVDSHNSMLPAVAAATGLDSNVRVDQVTAMNLADGSGGLALVPTLAVVNPIVFGEVSDLFGTFSSSPRTVTQTHTPNVADNYVLTCLEYLWNTDTALSTVTRTVTYGGAAMTSIGSIDLGWSGSNRYAIEMWRRAITPGAGPQTVSATVTRSGANILINGPNMSYRNATSTGTTFTDTGTSLTGSHTFASAEGRKIIHMFARLGTGGTEQYGGSSPYFVTQRGGRFYSGLAGDVDGAASVTIGFRFNTTVAPAWGSIATELIP